MAISDWMVENYGLMGFNAKRVYNGVDLEAYPYSYDHGDRLLFVGRIAEFKQPHVAIKAALEADYSIDIVGGTFVDNHTYVDKVVKMAEDPRVTVHLDVSHDKKIELLQQAKAVLFPSAMGEPFGLVIVESMACGTPVIALEDGAVSEIITSKTGIVCRAKSEDEAVELMAQAIKDIDCKPIDCRNRASEFSSDVMAQNYLDAYKDVLKGDTW
jgi:glycosyltransferase involved in cell wall biosynthesis